MKPLISVVVPVYGVEAYLRRCVDSLLAQTYENTEIILVDDGSPDACPDICEEYARLDARIRVIHQQNQGLSGARNTGIDAAQGTYLAFVDSDDYVAPDFLKALQEAAEETSCPIAQCRFAYVHGDVIPVDNCGSFHIHRGKALMEQLYRSEEEATCFVVAWNKLYRRELFDRIRYPQGRIHEDEATTYLLFHEAKKLVCLDRTLYGYYMGNSGSITSHFSGKRMQWLTAHEERIRFFEENGYGYQSLLPQAYKKLCDACITFYARCTDEVEDAAALRKELRERHRAYCRKGAVWIKKLPLQTRAGYMLFHISPAVYYRLLKRIQKS